MGHDPGRVVRRAKERLMVDGWLQGYSTLFQVIQLRKYTPPERLPDFGLWTFIHPGLSTLVNLKQIAPLTISMLRCLFGQNWQRIRPLSRKRIRPETLNLHPSTSLRSARFQFLHPFDEQKEDPGTKA